jgi:hypothetical protein
MKDIQVPGAGQRGPVGAPRPIIPIEQSKKYVPPQVKTTTPVRPQYANNNREYFQPPNNSRKYLALGLFLSLLLISIIFFLATFAFDGATITIKPLKKETPISETYIVSEMERKELLQPKVINVLQEISVPKKSVKKVFRKAEGEVTIYNSFSNQSQKFVKGTRLSTTDNKIFRIQESVTVPGKSGETAGSVKVKVIADQDGPEYNIGPTKFTVPGLKASPKYKDFWAENDKTMKGGASGSIASVSDVDLQKGLNDMKQKLIESVQEKIDDDVPEGFVYNKDTLVLQTGKFEKIAEDENTATYQQAATGTTLFFKRDEIVKRVLEKQNSNENSKPVVKVLDTSKFEVSVTNQAEAINSDSQVTLTLTGVAPAVFYPNKQAILEYYAGRPVSEFNDIAKKFQFIESAKRVIYPFWNTRFPYNISKITIEFEE